MSVAQGGSKKEMLMYYQICITEGTVSTKEQIFINTT